MTIPKQLKLGQVPKYLSDKYGLEVTRQTVYNWASKGLRNDTLQVTHVRSKPTNKYPNVKVTTDKWVDDFLLRCGIELPRH